MPHKKKLKDSIKLLVVAIISLLSLGTVIFSWLEGWNLVDSFYFVTMTATTVGYGDFIPTHALSKIITVAYSLMIIPFILYAFTAIAKFEVERVHKQISGIQRKQLVQETEIEKTERKIREQKKLMKEQQEVLDKQDAKLKKQSIINKEQEEELEGQEKQIKKAVKVIKEHDKELDVVEDIVEEQIIKGLEIKK